MSIACHTVKAVTNVVKRYYSEAPFPLAVISMSAKSTMHVSSKARFGNAD